MPLIVPSRSSTFGDAAWTRDRTLFRKYILAQFRSESDFTWVRETREFLGVQELKFETIRANKPRLCEDCGRWASVQAGVRQASLIVIDTARVHRRIWGQAMLDGADFWEFERPEGLRSLQNQCAAAIVNGTPIAYLPASLLRAMEGRMFSRASLERFSPDRIRQAIGPTLQDARVFAARAHALFDVQAADDDTIDTCGIFHSPLHRVILAELVSTRRAFDEEAPRTVGILNDAAAEIASAMSRSPVWGDENGELVHEVESKALDELQAADIAAGWARDLLDLSTDDSGIRGFRRVWINGRRSA